MKTYHALFEVDVADVGLAKSLAASVVTRLGTTTVGAIEVELNGRRFTSQGYTAVEAWGTAAQLDEIAEKLHAATIGFKERRLPYVPTR